MPVRNRREPARPVQVPARVPAPVPVLRVSPAAIWPFRRRVVAAALLLPLGGLALSAGTPAGVWWAVPVAVGYAVPAALILASYLPLPGSGRLLDPGCSTCAPAGAAAVLGAFGLRLTSPDAGGTAMIGLSLLALGLLQRWTATGSCTRSAPVTAADDEGAAG